MPASGSPLLPPTAAPADIHQRIAQQHVQKAALFVQDAWSGLERVHPQQGRWYRSMWLVHLALHWPVKLSVLLLIGLTFLEAPAWTAAAGPDAFNTTLYPNFGLPLLPPAADAPIELLLLAILVVDASCMAAAQGRYFVTIILESRKWLYLLALAIATLEALTSASGLWTASLSRCAPILRLLLLILNSPVLLSQLDLMRRTLPQVAGIFLVLVTFVCAFAWAGVILFEGAEKDGFLYMGASIWKLFICLTTANFPDVMLPEYNTNRFAFFYFAPFLLIGHFFLLNLVLAVVVKAHSDSREATTRDRVERQQKALRSAFASLIESLDAAPPSSSSCSPLAPPAAAAAPISTSAVPPATAAPPPPPPRLPQETVIAMFKELNLYREIEHIGEARAALLFAALDRSGDRYVDESEFLLLCGLLRIKFERVPKRTWLQIIFPALAYSLAWRNLTVLIKSRRFDYFVDILLLVAGVALVVEEVDALHHETNRSSTDFDSNPFDSPWNILELTLSFLFLLEMIVKLAALGTRSYFRSLKNTFDAISTISTVATVYIVYLPNAIDDARFIRFVLLLRLLRLLRLLSWSPQVRFVASTFIAILPDAHKLLQMLFVLLYTFASIGLALFGGLINRDPSRPELLLLANTSFAASDYWANNFNDLASGVVLCFELLLVNNWFILCEGFEVTASKWARLFFIAFYICGPLLLLNVAVAVAMDAFLTYTETEHTPQKKERDAADALHWRRGSGVAMIDASQAISGTQTGLEGEYRAYATGVPRSQQLALLQHWLLEDAQWVQDGEYSSGGGAAEQQPAFIGAPSSSVQAGV